MVSKIRFYIGVWFMYLGGIIIGIAFSKNIDVGIGIGLLFGTVGNLASGGFKYKETSSSAPIKKKEKLK